MADTAGSTTPARRVLPNRHRRESTAKREASSPTKQETPAREAIETSNNVTTTAQKRATKKIKVSHVHTPIKGTPTPALSADEVLPTKAKTTRVLPSLAQQQGSEVSGPQYQSIADSAILAASLYRSRMQWLCDGVFRKYWTKPNKRKNAPTEPADNPDSRSMQKLGNATITIDPHTFEAIFYIVRETQPVASLAHKPSPQPLARPFQTPATAKTMSSVTQPAIHAPTTSTVLTPAPATTKVTPNPAKSAQAPLPARPATPPGGAKATDPVIQMLANRAATDPRLKELMKVVAQSKASTEQLREFQAHIDEFNALIKQRQAAKDVQSKSAVTASTPVQPAYPRVNPSGVYRSPLLTPAQSTTPYTVYPSQPRPEPLVKHIVLELTSAPAAAQAPNPDRWLFPEYAVLDTQYGGTEMTCSFFVERKGADILAQTKDTMSEDSQTSRLKWNPETMYYEPVTIVINAINSKTIATIASAAKSLPQVQKYMGEVMQSHTRAPQEYLAYHLPKAKIDSDFVDSAVELSEVDELQDYYPM